MRDKRQESEIRRQESDVRSQKSDVRNQTSDDRDEIPIQAGSLFLFYLILIIKYFVFDSTAPSPMSARFALLLGATAPVQAGSLLLFI